MLLHALTPSLRDPLLPLALFSWGCPKSWPMWCATLLASCHASFLFNCTDGLLDAFGICCLLCVWNCLSLLFLFSITLEQPLRLDQKLLNGRQSQWGGEHRSTCTKQRQQRPCNDVCVNWRHQFHDLPSLCALNLADSCWFQQVHLVQAEKMAAAVPSLGGTSLVSRSVTVRLDDSEVPLSPLSAGGTVPMDLDVKGEGPTTPHELHAGDFQATVFAWKHRMQIVWEIWFLQCACSGLRSLLESKECWLAQSVQFQSFVFCYLRLLLVAFSIFRYF